MQHIRPVEPEQKHSKHFLCPLSFLSKPTDGTDFLQREKLRPIGFFNNGSLNTTETSTEANDIIIPHERIVHTHIFQFVCLVYSNSSILAASYLTWGNAIPHQACSQSSCRKLTSAVKPSVYQWLPQVLCPQAKKKPPPSPVNQLLYEDNVAQNAAGKVRLTLQRGLLIDTECSCAHYFHR